MELLKIVGKLRTANTNEVINITDRSTSSTLGERDVTAHENKPKLPSGQLFHPPVRGSCTESWPPATSKL